MREPESDDHVETHIGDDARNVAVGKQITQFNAAKVYLQGTWALAYVDEERQFIRVLAGLSGLIGISAGRCATRGGARMMRYNSLIANTPPLCYNGVTMSGLTL